MTNTPKASDDWLDELLARLVMPVEHAEHERIRVAKQAIRSHIAEEVRKTKIFTAEFVQGLIRDELAGTLADLDVLLTTYIHEVSKGRQ